MGVGNGDGRVRCEHGDGFFVLLGELPPALLLGEVDVAQPVAAIADRGAEKALHRRVALGKADRPGVAGDVPEPQRPLGLVEEPQQSQALRAGLNSISLVRSDAGSDEVLEFPEVTHDQERAVTGAGQGAGLVYDPLQDGAEVQLPGDAEGGLAQPGKTVPQRLYLPLHPGGFLEADARAGHGLLPGVGPPGRDVFEWRTHGEGIISPGAQIHTKPTQL